MRARWMAAVVAAVTMMGAGAGRAQGVDEDQELLRMSARAESAVQHSQVAVLLTDRADVLDGQAARLLKTSQRLEKS
ncbi:MAG TPA: hypothetical protein VMF13_07305, partial [Luteitalea sp.]|nr:hypothetical protein [Luteitalea sp.]